MQMLIRKGGAMAVRPRPIARIQRALEPQGGGIFIDQDDKQGPGVA